MVAIVVGHHYHVSLQLKFQLDSPGFGEGLNRGPEDRGPRTGAGTEDQDPGLDPFFCMGGCGTHIEITSVKQQDFALHCRIHWCSSYS